MEMLSSIWEIFTVQYPVAGYVLIAMSAVLLLAWGVKASSY